MFPSFLSDSFPILTETPVPNSEKSSQPPVNVPDERSAETVSPCGLQYVNQGDWDYHAVLPNTSAVFGVGRNDDHGEIPFHSPRVVLHRKRTARIPTTIVENERFLGQLSVETTQWKLGINNPYLALRDDVDHTDAILEELHATRVEHSKRDIVKPPVLPLHSKKKYAKARKPKYIPHFGVIPFLRSSFPFVPSYLHCATLFNRHRNYQFSDFNPLSIRLQLPLVKRSDPVYVPQFDDTVSSAIAKFKSLAAMQNLPLPDNFLSRFEDLILFFVQIKEVRSNVQLIAILIAYYKTFVSGSVLRSVEAFVQSLFDTKMVGQAGEPDDPNWLSYLREGKTTWNILVNCSAFERVSKLLSLCVTLGMCEASNLTFSLGKFKLFSIEAQKKHVTALDLVDAFANTVFYFVEGGYRVFTSGSLAPLIYSDFEAKGFDENCGQCERLAEFAKTGDLERLGNITSNEFENLLLNTLDKGHQLLNMTHSVSEKAVFRSRLDRLKRIQTELIQTRLTSGLRVAPFVVSFFGGSGQGKSSLAKIAMNALLEANGFSSDPQYICSVNENDKFFSTYRSCVNGVFVDDVANAKADFVDRPPSQILIDLNNNVPTYALQAEADKKGKVVIEPKIVICTTNVKDLGATVYSNEPVSIARRADIHITTRVKPQFATNGMLDPNLVWRAFPDESVPIQDIWDLTVQEVVAIPSISKNGIDSIGWKTLQLNGELLQDVSVEKALRVCIELSRAHFNNQRRLVASANSLKNRLEICKNCGMPSMYCKCPSYGPFFPGHIEGYIPNCSCSDTTVCLLCQEYSEKSLICVECDRIVPTCRMVSDPLYSADLAINHYCHCFGKQRCPGEFSFTPDTLPPPRVYDEQAGALLASVVSQYGARWFMRSSKKYNEIETRLEEYATSRLFQIAHSFENSWICRWTNWIPKKFLSKQWCKDIVCYMEKESILGFAHKQIYNAVGCCAIASVLSLVDRPVPVLLPPALFCGWLLRYKVPRVLSLPIFWFSAGAPLVAIPSSFTPAALTSVAISSYCLNMPFVRYPRPLLLSIALFSSCYFVRRLLTCKEIVFDEIVKRNDAIPAMIQSVREQHVETLLKYCAIVGAIYTVCQIWIHLRVVPEAQGSLSPSDLADIVQRDAEANPWAIPDPKPLPCSLKSKSVTHTILCDLVFNNLAYMSCEIDGRVHSCDAFFPFSNVAIIPQHSWKVPELKCNFIRKDPMHVGANFSCFLSQSQSVHIPHTDFCLVWVPSGGDWKDLRPYFPTGKLSQLFGTLVYKNKLGERIDGPTTALYGVKETGACKSFYGCSYILPFNTFRGLCMAPLVSHTNGPMIAGFHLGGVENSPQGCAGLLTIAELDAALVQLANKDGVLLSKSSGTVEKIVYGVQWFESDKIHPKSPVNFLPLGTNCELYGSCTGRAKYYSEVVSLPISQSVCEIMAVPPLWGKPKFSTASWRESLLYSCQPTIGMEPSLLEGAYKDYVHQLDSILLDKRWKSLIDDSKPLTQMETVCGIDGKRFIDKMPPNTSVGFPLSGPKSQYLDLLDPQDFPSHNCPAILDPIFWEEAMQCEKKYLDGERAYPVFKACLKDEPTKLDKDKVRVFQASPMALQLLVRKYFLPLARLLSLFPLKSECAVGINAQSPEWHEVMTHVGRFGNDTTLAGDYSKYDLRMPAQLTFAAFRILLHVAQRCNYTEYDLIIMSGIATDVCYPLMAYNGDVIQHYGSNPSGQNLTVYINCIVNSLLFRCGAIALIGDRFTSFSDVCSLITYGDDADSTVNPEFPEFNHVSYANFLNQRGIVFTLPDKTGVPTPYMSRSESHFLKRESKILGDTGILCGALEEYSIFKSLHCVLRSKSVTLAEQSICNLNGAAREFFFHGPEVYETRRLQLIEVARCHNFLPLCPDLQLTFEDRLEKWKEQYTPDLKCL